MFSKVVAKRMPRFDGRAAIYYSKNKNIQFMDDSLFNDFSYNVVWFN